MFTKKIVSVLLTQALDGVDVAIDRDTSRLGGEVRARVWVAGARVVVISSVTSERLD